MKTLEELCNTPRYLADGYTLPKVITDENLGHDLVKIYNEFKPHTILEIGCHDGVSTEIWAKLANKVIAIDIILRPALNEVLKRNNNIEFYCGNSDDIHNKFKNESIDLLYIDGDHNYESVKKDLNNYFPKVKLGGVICGHDICCSMVKQALEEKLGKNYKTYTDTSWSIIKK